MTNHSIFTEAGKRALLKTIRKTLVGYGISPKADGAEDAALIFLNIEQTMLKMAHASGMKGSPHEPEEPPEGDGTPIEAAAIA